MRVWPSPARYFFACLCTAFFSVSGATLDDLRNIPDLTPGKFAACFRDFEFEFRRDVQSPEVFLATRSGDCDDYSALAALVLREKGYTPRLISVRMPGVTHVVCYIEETQSYLDYNLRAFPGGYMVECGPEIDAIARRVASAYHTEWSSASEFTCEDGLKRLVQTVAEPKRDAGKFASLFR